METWYILEDGAFADPDEVAPGDDGVLRHSSGIAVAYGPHGPRSRGMSAEEIGAYGTREMRPEKPKRPYRAREMKAD